MAEILIWVSLAVLFYVHLGYPLLLLVWRGLRARPVRKAPCEPTVSVVLAAHNEKERIEAKIRNLLEMDYPREKLQVVVALDAPTDGTEEIVWKFAGRNIDVIYYSPHRGKAGALNRAVAAAEGEIVVFADARQQFARNAVRELVANFSDPSVGAVSGELVLLDAEGREASDGVGLYWRYEKWLRSMEAGVHSLLGATGAIYAIRRELFSELREDTILDDVVTPMRIVLAGRRVVFDPAARAWDRVAEDPQAEYGRKVRTLMGNYQLLELMPELLVPGRNPVWLQFVSHKLGRLVVPWFLALLWFANLFALHGGYAVLFGCQALWWGLACGGHFASRSASRAQDRLRRKGALVTMPFRVEAASGDDQARAA